MTKYWNQLNSLEKASIVIACFLLICILPLPYGFYTIIRLAMSLLAGCWAYHFYSQKKIALALTSLGILILFQPIVKITMDRLSWNILDIIIAVTLIFIVLSKIVSNKSQTDNEINEVNE